MGQLKPLLLALTVAAVGGGCMTPDVTKTARSGVEQLLVSNAVDRACLTLELAPLNGRKVLLDLTTLEAVDKPYVCVALRQRLRQAGALLTEDAKTADLIVEVSAGAVATDQSEMFIGLPAIPVPIPMAGSIKTPEVALFKKNTQTGIVRLTLAARQTATGAPVPLRPEPATASAYFNRWTLLLLFHWSTSDLPEKKPHYSH